MPLVRWFFCCKKKTLRDSTEIPVQRVQDLRAACQHRQPKSSTDDRHTVPKPKLTNSLERLCWDMFSSKDITWLKLLRVMPEMWIVFPISYHFMTISWHFVTALAFGKQVEKIKKGRVALEETWSSDDGGHAHRARTKQPRKVAKAFQMDTEIRMERDLKIWT